MPAPLFRMFRPYASAGLEVGTQLRINHINRTSIIHDATQLTFTATMGQRGTCGVPLCIDADNPYDPQIGDFLEIFELDPTDSSSFRAWAGTTDARQYSYIDDEGLTIADLTGVSLEQFYDTQPAPAQEFNSTTAGAIATALFNSVSNPFGITLGTVDPGVSINNRVFDGKTSIWAGIAQLATDSNVIAYIDPRDLKFYFHARDTRPAPWDLTSGDIFNEGTLGASFKYKQSRSDFRDKQIIQTVPNTLPPSGVVFTGDGFTVAFTLPSPATQVLSATVTLSTQATATGTLASNLAPGDTITIQGQTYTAVAVIDNTVSDTVLVGPANANTAQNIVDAINANPAAAGIGFSSPTQANLVVQALPPTGAAFVIRALPLGTHGNAVTISETSSHFSWSGSTLTGGIDGTVAKLSIGIAGAGSFGLTYSPGSTSITLQSPPATGALLSISYVSAGGSLESGNNASVGLGITSQFIASTAHNVTQQVDVEQQAAAILAAFSILPGTFSVIVIRPGLSVGQLQTVNLTVPARAAALLNGNWLIQDIVANWVEGFEFTETPCFWYTITYINSTQISPYQDTLARLADTGPVNNQQPTDAGGDSFAPIAAPRTFLVKDSTVGTNIADIVPIITPMTLGSPVVRATQVGQEIVATLKVTISADLVLRVNKTSQGSPVIVDQWTITIPSTASPGYTSETFINEKFNHLDLLSFDVLASDGQIVADGIASLTVVWG